MKVLVGAFNQEKALVGSVLQTGVGFSPPRLVNLPFCYLGLAKGRLSSVEVSYSALTR